MTQALTEGDISAPYCLLNGFAVDFLGEIIEILNLKEELWRRKKICRVTKWLAELFMKKFIK